MACITEGVVFVTGYQKNLVARITELHANYYAKNWGFGHFFEDKVAGELNAYMESYDSKKDQIMTVLMDNSIEASIAIDGEPSGRAHLRWFIVSERLKGKGVGNQLMEYSLDFCEKTKADSIYLWTFKGLDSAAYLYKRFGFRLQEEFEGKQWGRSVIEQCYEKIIFIEV